MSLGIVQASDVSEAKVMVKQEQATLARLYASPNASYSPIVPQLISPANNVPKYNQWRKMSNGSNS